MAKAKAECGLRLLGMVARCEVEGARRASTALGGVEEGGEVVVGGEVYDRVWGVCGVGKGVGEGVGAWPGVGGRKMYFPRGADYIFNFTRFG